MRTHRSHIHWLAYMLHRTSGLALVLFLPIHFYVLSLAITNPKSLDGLLLWAENPWVKATEFGLVLLLGIHFFGGLRIMALEFLPWTSRQKTLLAAVFAGSFIAAFSFLLGALQ